MIRTEIWTHRPSTLEVVQTTEDNIKEIAAWMGGVVRTITYEHNEIWVEIRFERNNLNFGATAYKVGQLIVRDEQGKFMNWPDEEALNKKFKKLKQKEKK